MPRTLDPLLFRLTQALRLRVGRGLRARHVGETATQAKPPKTDQATAFAPPFWDAPAHWILTDRDG